MGKRGRRQGGTAVPVVEVDRRYDGPVPEWLAAEGLAPTTIRRYDGADLPARLAGSAALVVLGSAPGDPVGAAGVEELLRAATAAALPTLAIGRGARLLATAHRGRVGPAAAGPAAGPALVARRDVAGLDPLFAAVPFTPDVVLWQDHEIVELPPGAVLLAASPRYPHQAFRLGRAAWGMSFHPAPDPAVVAGWAAADGTLLARLGREPEQVVADVTAAGAGLAEVWRPVLARFAAVVRGELASAASPDLSLRPR